MSSSCQQSCSRPKLGTYWIDRTIGRGVFSVVRLGTHTITGIQVAMKIVDKTRLDSENLKKVRLESEILKRLHHPNIVRLFQVMETTKLLCTVMEYLPNGEIFDYVAVRGKILETEARMKFMEVLRAVHYIHTCGVVHRDLKAENLLFDAEMNIKIVDFSFGTRYADVNNPPLLSTWCGSPPYAAPEIFQGEPYVGTKADIWSLGVVLYVMVCGTLPFDAQPLPLLKRQVVSGTFHVPQWLSHECEDLMRSMLRKDPSSRPTAGKLMHHPWFHASSVENSQCSSFRTRCISDLGAAVSSRHYSQEKNQPVSLRSIDAGGGDDKASLSNGRKRYTTSVVTQFDHELSLAADLEVGKFNEQVLAIMEFHGLSKAQVLDSLSRKNYDHLTATYLLLGEKLNRRGKCFSFPCPGPVKADHNSVDIPSDSISTPLTASDSITTVRYGAKCSLNDSAVDVKYSFSNLESVDSRSTTQSAVSSPRPGQFDTVGCMINDFTCTNHEGFKTCRNADALRAAGHSTYFFATATSSIDYELPGNKVPRVTGAFHTTSYETSIPTVSFPATGVLETFPARRHLTRRKYGIRFRDDALCQFTQNALEEQVNMDRMTDSDISEDGAPLL